MRYSKINDKKSKYRTTYPKGMEQCIKDQNGCIVAWTAGMSQEEISDFVNKDPFYHVDHEKMG